MRHETPRTGFYCCFCEIVVFIEKELRKYLKIN